MSEIVKYCPTNLTEIIAASARLNCGEDRFGNDQYLCLPNVRKTGLVEYCHEGVIPLIPSGYCVDTTGGQLYSRICEQFLYGCPSQHFQTNKIYRYPACLNINTESRCYFADPSCPNTTSTFTTEDMMETSSTYSNFSNTTVNTLYTTTTSLEDVTDVGAVVGGVLAAVFVITVLLILVCVVLRRRKQRKNQPSDGRDAETPLFESTNETGNRTEKNSNSPTDSHEPDNNDSVHDEGRDAETPLLGRDAETPHSHEPDNKNSVPDEVKNQIKRRGIDFLLSMSTEHGEYHNGIAQLLNVPVEVLGMGKEEIETFVRNYKKGSTKVYCGRGMVVGCFGAGKTTLVKKLKGEDVSLPPESTRGLEVHTDIFTVNQNETVLAVNKDQKGRQRLQINLDTLRSGVVKPSSDTDRSNANAYDDEIPNTTISSAIDLETSGSGVVKPSSDADRSNSNAYDDEIPNTTISSAMHLETSGSGVVKPSTDAERSDPKTGDEIPSTTISPAVDLGTKESEVVKTSSDIHGNQRSDETGKHHVKDLAIYRSTETVANKKDKNQQIPGHEIGMILPNVIDKPVKTISLLDFAGQDAYYACHHIFLSPRSFYILVTDMSKKLTEKPTNALQRKDLMYSDWTHQDYINHWLGSIHTYSSKTAPVILVQSHSEKKEKKEKEDYFLKVLQDVTDTLHVHLSTDKVFAVEKDSDENIEEIKSSMLKIVKNQNHWGESIPTSWVHLEAYLMEIKKQQMVLQKKDLWETLAFQSSQPDLQLTSKEDMTTALRFFNDIGVILFTTSSESIILDVQWFVDAFKHIITDESHAKHDITKHFTDWRKFNANGILPKNLVKEIWRGSESLTRYTEDLIFHLIRLGMIAEIEKGEKYYVPCMNKQKYNTKVLNKCACSYIVCFTFQYLPLVIYHRLVATCMTEEGWRIWDGNDQKETANTSKCVFHTAAILQGKDDLKILIGITENKHNLYDEKHENRYPYSIEIQGFVLENQTMQPQFARSKLKRIREHLKDLTSCFGANRDRAFKIGYRCSITPFSDTPDSHIILLSEKECTTCRKSVNVDDMRSFWMDDARSENDIFHIDEEKQERKNKDEDNETQLKIQHADNVSIFESNNKTRNRRVENGNFPADSHEPDNNDSVHNEGNEGDTTSLQPLTDVQQDNDSGGYRPNVLHEACKNAKLEMCEHLIKTHPNLLHSVDNNGWNAALHTALGGNVKILQLLADNEVDVKHKDNYGWNILQMACLNANLEMSRYIVQTYPVLLHSVDNNGWNAALHAARGGNLKILQLLADNEVDVKHKDNYGRNILHAACVHANLEMSRYIIQTYPDLLHSVDKYGWNAALYAVKGGNVKILQLLADNEVDVKHKDNDGRNILHAACVHANLEMSRYIIQTYPDLLHSVNNNGRNAALHAALGGNVKILQLLADNEVDVKHKDNYGWNILQMACLNANLEMSRYIVQTYPVLLHSVDNNGWNAALHAARGGNVKILQLLADNEVDVKHKDNDGRNILHAACVHANLEMSRYIIQTYPDLLHSVDKYGCNAALYAVKGGNVKILQLLADNEVDVKHKDNDGRNILHAACVHANLEMSRYIIQTYPDLLHSVNNDGQNAAFFAALGGNVKILELLADHGVKIKTEN
ncbi:uncharacterized protein LOC125664362 isoform X4 [Ostrea edulis]|uniref:uncharacterized protein LOC125664362 isoform X4 n=1 Tax=Ostrea edulis TaxID=37623 RepID=UPI0024AE8AA6|nr:uncharacterized protein LOC125664362 isoform X4 [Ostrea edulis]